MANPLTPVQQEWVDGLRSLAGWFEDNPDLIPSFGSVSVNLFKSADETPVAYLARMARRFGRCEKDTDGIFFFLLKRFGPHRVEATAPSDQVCEQVQVGTETVEERVGEDTRPVAVVEKPVYAWKCPPSILAAADHG